LLALGGATVVLITSSGGEMVSDVVKGLRPRGSAIVIGVSPQPIKVLGQDLLFGGRKIHGALTGNPATGDATLKFSSLSGAKAMIETMPLERAPEAYAKMMAGEARFRMVLTMQQ
jgi:propanol-preferring alcohol dehydrogenase